MRTGLWVSGAGGSGILVARKPDGTWSPPSGILLHTAGLGFLVGVDIYDCVVVLNTQQAVDAFSSIRCTLGGEISAVAGPVGVGGLLESEVHKRQAPLFTYLKSRGFYAGVQIDGTVIIERGDENERFYGQRLPVKDILAGKVTHEPREIKTLIQTIKAAQGDKDVDESLITDAPPPGDYEVEESGHVFGVPDSEDPDPYGVNALEKEGLEIREAGTRQRPSSEAFDFNPSPSSPIFNTYRRSLDNKSISARSSFRISTYSTATAPSPKSPRMMDMSTQTDDLPSPPMSARRTSHASGHISSESIPENQSTDNVPTIREPLAPTSVHQPLTPPPDTDDREDRDLDEEHEPAVVHEVQTAATPINITRARLVTVSKPSPPKLPPRNPIRDRKRPLIINADSANDLDMARDKSTGTSPVSYRSRNSVTEQSYDASVESLADGFQHVDIIDDSQKAERGREQEKAESFHSAIDSPERSRSQSTEPWNPWKNALQTEQNVLH